MNKEELLRELSVKINAGEISREEVISHFHKNSSAHFPITKILYILGAAVALIGLIIFVSQIWGDLGPFGRIAITLGMGLITAGSGSMLLKNQPEDNIGTIFHIIGGVLIPGGALVALNELNVDLSSTWPVAITFGVIFAFYFLLSVVHKNAALTFFAIANGTAFIYILVETIIAGPFYNHKDLYAYLTMLMGISYFLLAYSFRDGWNNILIGILYFCGITGFLGAAFSQVFDSVPWQMLYFFLIIGGIFLAVYMRTRSILIVSTLFLIAHVSYITEEYFANSLGWPICLVILGFLFIGLGYASITINKKYIS